MHDVLNGNYGGLTWANLNHATHVAGIVAANKDGAGMYGVAYDAGIASSSAAALYYPVSSPNESPGFSFAISMYDYYLTNPDIKIINNSWGSNGWHISAVQNQDDFYDLQSAAANDDAMKAMEKAVHNDKLLVFCAMNEGNLTAAWQSDFDILTGDKAFNDNIITVINAKANSFTKNEKDGFDVKSDAIAINSNLAMYNEDTSLSAPGWVITSAYADFENPDGYGNYLPLSGTSASAPIVSGVGALVQQAFPYLGGKQIGDVLLSTANKNIESNKDYFITLQQYALEEGTKWDFNIYFTGQAPEGVDKWDILYEYYKENPDVFLNYFCNGDNELFNDLFGHITEDNFKDEIIELFGNNYIFGENSINVYQNVPLDVIFGQGIVDAGKAVNGLGAINVRRLDKSDISSNYTVYDANKNESVQTKQALYTVDTQGYNSVWSNDISEIRAGYIAEKPLGADNTDFNGTDGDIKDLYDRWNFYMNSGNKFDESGDNWMTEEYIKIYNNMMEDTGLIGLHAGLYKTGDGILALTGNNTYKGASIAVGGTLQIDGSVAGDAYSEGKGTIAGSGIVNGSLYNNGTVAAGSWGAVWDDENNKGLQLTVNGNLTGNGVIAVNTNGEKYATINVDGTADVSEMNLKAGTFAAPGVNGTILTSDKAINGVDNLNTDFSGLLNGEVEQNVNAKNELTLTTSASNNAGINSDRFNAINSLYSGLSKEERQEMHRLYALDNNEVQEAVQNISASEGMHLEMAHDALQNRDIRQAATRQQHLDRDEGLWAISGKSWGEADGGITRHSFNMTIGRDFYNNDDSYMGAMFAYSDNSIGGHSADGEYDNYSLSLYGGTKNNPGTVTGYLSYGVQDNEMTRYLSGAFSHSGLGSKAESNYDSSVIGAGVKYAYDLDYGKADVWPEVYLACIAAASAITI